MNSSDLFGFAIILISGVIIFAVITDVETTKAAAQAGLQQCVVRTGFGTTTVWQKECK